MAVGVRGESDEAEEGERWVTGGGRFLEGEVWGERNACGNTFPEEALLFFRRRSNTSTQIPVIARDKRRSDLRAP